MEVWLPDKWTGRVLAVGNSGLDGCIHYDDINYGVSAGFATVGTNNGHDGGGAAFYRNPGTVEDYVSRAIHTASSVVKEASRAYYGKRHTKAYYLGCSTGGRQGFKEAQSFPDDFDGIVAGAPAINFNSLIYWSGHFSNLLGRPGSPTFLTPAEWNLVYADVLKQCDHLDGVVDGVLEDPHLCHYRPEALLCAAGRTNNCLTAAQAGAVRAVFSPLRSSQGDLMCPRMQPGPNFANIFAAQPLSYSTEWFRYVVYNDPSWAPSQLSLKDWVAAERLNPFNVATRDGDLSKFQNRGGKILHYHGLEDPVISSENSIWYYDHVSRTMGLPPAKLDDFYRFFRISGLGHCAGGRGAGSIGNTKSTVASLDPLRNVLFAMVKWVEQGVAPEVIRGTKHANGDASSRAVAHRDHCKYPLRNVYNGHADAGDAASWKCQSSA
ncbi:hypothetical protein UVI_02012010 [Ustilaginoidea virens]|nr:hypothetical protein UVI_02012010 [Ustilaginoidea virens]